jgi:hypothetical protein
MPAVFWVDYIRSRLPGQATVLHPSGADTEPYHSP